MKITTIAALASALAGTMTGAASPAFAQEDAAPFQRSWYVGVGLGAGTVTADGATEEGFDFNGDPFVFEGRFDYDTGVAASLVGGYNLSPYFAVEAEATGRTNDFDGNAGDADFAVSTLMAGVVAKMPAGPVEPYLGAAAGLVSNNLEGGDNAFGYLLKGGLRVPFANGRHAVGAEASFVFTDGFGVDTGFDDVDLELEYEHAAYMLTYRFTAQ